MYQEEFKRWLAADLEDPDLKPELSRIEGNDDEIKERFAVDDREDADEGIWTGYY